MEVLCCLNYLKYKAHLTSMTTTAFCSDMHVFSVNLQKYVDNHINYHNYTDDAQIGCGLSSDYDSIDCLCRGIEQINDLTCLNFLQLNAETTEIIGFDS